MEPTEQKPIRTTKGGIDLATFEDIKLYKDVAPIPPVTSAQDALTRLDNDHAKFLSIIHAGLQAEAVENARSSDAGWLKIDENGKDTDEEFAGTLVSGEILNPVVLTMSRINPTTVLRDGVEVEITWDDCQNAEEKRAVKAGTLDFIRATPKIVDGLKKKMATAARIGSE